MRLYRLYRKGGLPQEHLGPLAGGEFWALATCHDLQWVDAGVGGQRYEADLDGLLAIGKVVWIANAEQPSLGWVLVVAVDLAVFNMVDTGRQDPEGYAHIWRASPYMPELYVWPRLTWRERKALRGLGQIRKVE